MKHSDRYLQMGLTIAFYRKRQKLKQTELAEKAGISRTFLSNIEAPNMRTSVSLETLFGIAEVLCVPPSQLLEFKT